MSQQNYNKQVVSELVSLGVGDLSECIEASKLVINYNDINDVAQKVHELKEKKQKQNRIDIFDASKMNEGTYYVDRIKHILSVYDEFIDTKQKNEKSIRSLICQVYLNQDINLFIKDYDDFILNIDELNYYINNQVCDMNKCSFIQRSYRNMDEIRNNNRKRRELYFNQNEEKEIAIYQILDTLHNILFHTFSMGLRIENSTKVYEKKENEQEENDDDNDDDDNDDDDDEKKEKDEVEINDEIYLSVRLKSMKKEIHQRMQNFIQIRPDFQQSTKQTVNSKFVTNVDDNNDDDNKKDVVSYPPYSFGTRFYYHDYYKHSNEQFGNLPGSTWNLWDDGNSGYKYKNWYISAKYISLKEELLNNTIYTLTLYGWMNTQEKAILKLNTSKQILVKYDTFEIVTAIKKGTKISHEHIMSILLYTNWTKLCSSFSSSYRKWSSSETDQELTVKHKEFAIWARLLRETVECFGEIMTHSEIKQFYHGISRPVMFDALSARFASPTSTTKSECIALNFAQNGVMITIPNSKAPIPFWNCVRWSDFPSEEELLFVGGFGFVPISSLVDIQHNLDYSVYIQSMRFFCDMKTGYCCYLTITKKYEKTLRILVNSRLRSLSSPFGNISTKKAQNVPSYMMDIFNNVCDKSKTVTFDFGLFSHKYYMQHLGFGVGWDFYGYKKLRKIFLNKDFSFFNIKMIRDLFPKTEKITIWAIKHDPYNKHTFKESINMNNSILYEIISALKDHTKHSIKQIEIFHPSPSMPSLQNMIKQNNSSFCDIGYKLEVTLAEHPSWGTYRNFVISIDSEL